MCHITEDKIKVRRHSDQWPMSAQLRHLCERYTGDSSLFFFSSTFLFIRNREALVLRHAKHKHVRHIFYINYSLYHVFCRDINHSNSVVVRDMKSKFKIYCLLKKWMEITKFRKNQIIYKGTCPRNFHDFCRIRSNNFINALQYFCLFFYIRSFLNEATIHPLTIILFFNSCLAYKITEKCIKQCLKILI